MDSQITRRRLLIDIVDQDWLKDTLPNDDVVVPIMELPELENENGNTQETLKEQEQKWTDLSLVSLNEQASVSPPK
ncbi:hypothetical protein HELRODRAFT_72771 [Helobdella robusta]|uniref:Anaphase-promoting complex subunit 13 n=1 Tax=Helobdella robusta TaxID=6412 RepID=T1G154_HELRO|nr:hypothetical protein HELRODRAFT_72771 [Helobdella robusta]ESO09947.1 hypothetical protein HELRODRAFT_72771 [Helobdella robusta]